MAFGTDPRFGSFYRNKTGGMLELNDSKKKIERKNISRGKKRLERE